MCRARRGTVGDAAVKSRPAGRSSPAGAGSSHESPIRERPLGDQPRVPLRDRRFGIGPDLRLICLLKDPGRRLPSLLPLLPSRKSRKGRRGRLAGISGAAVPSPAPRLVAAGPIPGAVQRVRCAPGWAGSRWTAPGVAWVQGAASGPGTTGRKAGEVQPFRYLLKLRLILTARLMGRRMNPLFGEFRGVCQHAQLGAQLTRNDLRGRNPAVVLRWRVRTRIGTRARTRTSGTMWRSARMGLDFA